MRAIFVLDIALASILDAFGVPKRQPDPITRELRTAPDGTTKESGKWWFDVSLDEDAEKAKWIMEAYGAARDWQHYQLDPEHPLYWMKGALENRETFLHWIRTKAVPMRIIQHGEKTVLLSDRASAATKQKMRNLIG